MGLFQGVLGLPPLILFVVLIAAFLQTWDFRAALAAVAAAAVIGDYFFVEPVREMTVHAEGLRLLVVFLLATGMVALMRRPTARYTGAGVWKDRPSHDVV